MSFCSAWKNLNENGMKKLEVGAKYMEKNCVCQGSFDVATCKYSASLVYAVLLFILLLSSMNNF